MTVESIAGMCWLDQGVVLFDTFAWGGCEEVENGQLLGLCILAEGVSGQSSQISGQDADFIL